MQIFDFYPAFESRTQLDCTYSYRISAHLSDFAYFVTFTIHGDIPIKQHLRPGSSLVTQQSGSSFLPAVLRETWALLPTTLSYSAAETTACGVNKIPDLLLTLKRYPRLIFIPCLSFSSVGSFFLTTTLISIFTTRFF